MNFGRIHFGKITSVMLVASPIFLFLDEIGKRNYLVFIYC